MKELGHRLGDAELDELKRSRYGDVRGRQTNLAESPAQLLLEAAPTKEISCKKFVSEPSADLGVATKPSEPQIDKKKGGGASGDGLTKVSTSNRISSPVKQREYRRPDGRKRIIPEAVGVLASTENISSGALSQALDLPLQPSDQRKEDNVLVPADYGNKESTVRGTIGKICDIKERSGVTARATITESLIVEKVPVTNDRNGNINVEPSGSLRASNITSLSIRVLDKKEGEDALPICLEARPREHALNDVVGMGSTLMMKETEISCTKGSQILWSDRISGKVTVLAGNANLWAVGCEDGCLQVGFEILSSFNKLYCLCSFF